MSWATLVRLDSILMCQNLSNQELVKLLKWPTCNLWTIKCICPTFLPWTGWDIRSIFKQSKAGLDLEFFFSKISCLTKAKESSLPYYLPMDGGRRDGFMLFFKVLMQSETQTALSRVWTQIADSSFYDNCHLNLANNRLIGQGG